MITQREAMSKFSDKRARFNPVYFKRDEDEIIEKLINVIKSCERENEYFTIKVKSFRVVDNYEEINQILYNYYEELTKNKPKNKKRINQYGYINLNESYIRLLIVTYYIKDRNEDDLLDVIIGVPRIIDKYYFMINGIMRSTLFQIVDGSTYNNGTSNAKDPSVTMKIVFMAARITRYHHPVETIDGIALDLTYYHTRIFNKGVPALKYIFAKFGYYGALDFLGLSGTIHVLRYPSGNSDNYCIRVSNEIYLESPKSLTDQNPMIQAVLSTLHCTIIPEMEYERVFDNKFWIRSLGLDFSGGGEERLLDIMESEDNGSPILQDTLEKGYSILDSFENIYDISTKESIRLPEEYKATTYHIFRWIMREFNALRLKENLDVGFKRIRFAEYIAALYAFKIARGIYRVSDLNKKASIQNIRKAIRTDPNFLLNDITKSKMVSYRNMSSDMDSMQALKFTYKGVSGLGESSNQVFPRAGGQAHRTNESIPDIYRTIHYSHLGRLDLDASSDGNPGITGTICPFAPNYDGFFQEYEEPNSWETEFLETMNEYEKMYHLKEAMEFNADKLDNEETEVIDRVNDAIIAMQQIIKPVINTDMGDYVSLEDIF